jgi:hypothetical protein
MQSYVRRFLPLEGADEMTPMGSMTLGVLLSTRLGFRKTMAKMIDSAARIGRKKAKMMRVANDGERLRTILPRRFEKKKMIGTGHAETIVLPTEILRGPHGRTMTSRPEGTDFRRTRKGPNPMQYREFRNWKKRSHNCVQKSNF